MRKVVVNQLIASTGESLLTNYYNQKLGNQFSDAREQPSVRAFKVGHPNGTIDVPAKRGWIYIQRVLPQGRSVVMECFVPSNKDGLSRVKFMAGQAITPKRTADTQPTYWIYDGIPPSTPLHHLRNQSECVGFYLPPSNLGSYGSGYYNSSNFGGGCDLCSSGVAATTMRTTRSTGSPVLDVNGNATLPPGIPMGYSEYDEADGFNETNSAASPVISPIVPSSANGGDLWQDPAFYTRRFNKNIPGRRNMWEIAAGPRTDTFIEVLAATGVELIPGKLVYTVVAAGYHPKQVGIASRDNIDCYDRILGVCMGRSTGLNSFVVQTRGMIYAVNHPDLGENLPVFLGVNGSFTSSPPAVGSNHIWQTLGIMSYGPYENPLTDPLSVTNFGFFLDIGQPIIRQDVGSNLALSISSDSKKLIERAVSAPSADFSNITIQAYNVSGAVIPINSTLHLKYNNIENRTDAYLASSQMLSPTRICNALALAPINIDMTGSCLIEGLVSSLVSLVPMQQYFLGPTPGSMSSNPPTLPNTKLQVVGRAISTTQLLFEPLISLIL